MRTIETILSPDLFHQVEALEDKQVVVIDILRASSTICTILDHGASAVRAVDSVAQAQEWKSKGYLAGGERGGEKVDGLDFGNSPFDYEPSLVQGKEIILTTTNGTRCIELAKSAHTLLVGSFLNLSAIVEALKRSNRDVILFCAAWKSRVNLEDSLFAGAISAAFKQAEKDDASIMCEAAYLNPEKELLEKIRSANHFKRLARLGVEKDMEFCCRIDNSQVVPHYTDGLIRPMPGVAADRL